MKINVIILLGYLSKKLYLSKNISHHPVDFLMVFSSNMLEKAVRKEKTDDKKKA